jgi:hypothetical protein
VGPRAGTEVLEKRKISYPYRDSNLKPSPGSSSIAIKQKLNDPAWNEQGPSMESLVDTLINGIIFCNHCGTNLGFSHWSLDALQ